MNPYDHKAREVRREIATAVMQSLIESGFGQVVASKFLVGSDQFRFTAEFVANASVQFTDALMSRLEK